MGIRIHKCIGYALTDVKFQKSPHYCPCDPRINNDSILLCDSLETDGEYTYRKYIAWLTDEADKLPPDSNEYHDLLSERAWLKEQHKDRRIKWQPFDSFIYQAEYGLGNVLLITAPTQHAAWCRYNDAIDYEETNLDHRENPDKPINYFRLLNNNGIYPWNMDRNEPVIPDAIRFICKFGKVFTDESVLHQLHPTLYVYWA